MASEAAPPAAYAALSKELSQGDIVNGMPSAVLEHPLVVCRQGGKPGQAFYAEPKDCNRQAAFSRGPEIIHALGHEPSLGMVIWEDCEIDKMRNQQKEERRWFVAVAPVVPLTVVREDEARAAIRAGRRQAFFPLPASEEFKIPESYVDLRLIWPVRQSMLTDRLVTLSAPNRSALYGHLLRFLTGRVPADDVRCPKCGETVSVEHFISTDA